MNECCVYWIRDNTHTDIFTEGYVGITNNFDYRINQHVTNCHNPKQYKNYRADFRESVVSGSYVVSKILIASREYCLEIEAKLRPTWVVGWNIAKGGSGGYGKHGLTGSKISRTFYNMLTRAEIENEEVYSGWLDAFGLENFKEFYDSMLKEAGEFTLKEKGKGYNPTNFVKLSRSEIIRRNRRRYDIQDGEFYSVQDLAEKFQLKANTISSRMRGGWTVREAVGLDTRENNLVYLSPLSFAKYKGKWSKEQLQQMKDAYESGITITKISEMFDIDTSNVLRFAKMFSFDRSTRTNKFLNFIGEVCELNLKSKFNTETVEQFKCLLVTGKSSREISEEMGIPIRTVYHMKDILKWRQYERAVEDSKLTLEG